ncbi:hypothetical protein SAMN05444380_12626 [Thermophagus xiamenensis]|uniref:Uncharacterized protein n=1 Tax=Thermophagus xiamenensis TaxID=385682 RepID=A0A1I2F5M0_9BACT|nr:hypothetical protein SAMN05444380_12626 [Thermophagus xiamenensis]
MFLFGVFTTGLSYFLIIFIYFFGLGHRIPERMGRKKESFEHLVISKPPSATLKFNLNSTKNNLAIKYRPPVNQKFFYTQCFFSFKRLILFVKRQWPQNQINYNSSFIKNDAIRPPPFEHIVEV